MVRKSETYEEAILSTLRRHIKAYWMVWSSLETLGNITKSNPKFVINALLPLVRDGQVFAYKESGPHVTLIFVGVCKPPDYVKVMTAEELEKEKERYVSTDE